MSTEGLEGFLDASRESGVRDSEGHFTVDHVRAGVQLEKFAFENSGDYLSKVVQAAHRMGAESLDLKLGVRSVDVFFTVPSDHAVLASPLGQALLSGSGPDPACSHLALAMRAAPAGEAIWRLGTRQQVSLSPGKLTQSDGEPEVGLLPARMTFGGGGLWNTVAARYRRADALLSLQSRARYSGLRVRIDGRDIERDWPRHSRRLVKGTWLERLPGAYYLMEGYVAPVAGKLPGLDFPPLRVDDWLDSSPGVYRSPHFVPNDRGFYDFRSGRNSSPFAFVDTLFRAYLGIKPGWAVGAAFALPMTLTGPARLTLMVDGVASRTKEVDLGLPSLLCVASGEGLKTDLAGLSVVEDQAYEQRLAELRKAAKAFAEVVRSRREDYLLRRPTRAGQGNEVPIYLNDIPNGVKKRLG